MSSTGFGEQIHPTDRIREVLNAYSFSSAILREILANSDDAGATEQRIALDCRTHPQGKILDSRIGDTQGPAVLAYNSSVFKEDDWDAIQFIGRSSKTKSTSKIGKFGLGIRSCYHITDYLQILSGTNLLIFDPLQTFSKDGGIRVTFNPENIDNVRDHFTAFSYFLPTGWNGERFDGTIVRLPLRDKPGLREKTLSPQDIQELFHSFIEKDLSICLLFVNHIRSITLNIVTEQGNVNQMASCTVNVDNGSGFDKKVMKLQVLGVESEDHWLMVHEHYPPETILQTLASRVGSPSLNKVLEGSKLCPDVGIAFPLHLSTGPESKANIGQLFTFLPLPVKTGFPAHIHALFALDSSRQHLCMNRDSGTMRGSENQIYDEWNRVLFETVIPHAWSQLLSSVAGAEPPSFSVFAAWPDPQLFATDGESAFWRTFTQAVLSTVLSRELSVWPVVGGGHRTLKDVFIFSRDGDVGVARALGRIGLQICGPVPQYLFDSVAATPGWSHRNLTPENASAVLRVNFQAQLRRASGDRPDDLKAILGYLLSNPRVSNIADLPIIPTVSGQFVSLSTSSTTTVYTLLEPQEFDIFHACDPNSIHINDLPPSTREWFKETAPGQLNLKGLDPAHVIQYLSLHPTRINVDLSSAYIDGAATAFLTRFWVWVSGWRHAVLLLPQLRFTKLLPCIGDGLEDADPETPVFDPAPIESDPALLTGLRDLGVPFLLPSDAQLKDVLRRYGLLRSPCEAKTLLRSLARTSTASTVTLSPEQAQHLLGHFNVYAASTRPLDYDETEVQALKALPIFPIVEVRETGRQLCVNTRRFSVEGVTVYGVERDCFGVLPDLPNIVFVDVSAVSRGVLALLNTQAPTALTFPMILDITLERQALVRQPQELLAAILTRVADRERELTGTLKYKMRSQVFVMSEGGTTEAPGRLIDPSSPLRALYADDTNRLPRVHDDVDRRIVSSLSSVGLLDRDLSKENVEDRIRYIADKAHFSFSVELLNILSRFDCEKLDLDGQLRWLPTQKGTLAPGNECRPGRGRGTWHDERLFDKVLEMISPRVATVPLTLITKMHWDHPIPVDTLRRQLVHVLQEGGDSAIRRVEVVLEELSKRKLSGIEFSQLKQALEGKAWVPASGIRGDLLVEAWRAVCSEDVFSGIHRIKANLRSSTNSRIFLRNLGCLDEPSFDTVKRQLDQLTVQQESQHNSDIVAPVLAALRFCSKKLTLSNEQREQLRVPDQRGQLHDIGKIVFNDIGQNAIAVPLPAEQHIAHGDISDALAASLRLERLGLKYIDLNTLGEDMGASPEDLVRESLSDYEVRQFLPEFLANAEDAGATTFEIIISNQIPSQGRFLSPAMEDLCTGPSVIIYNDSRFTDTDFEGICRTRTGGKANRDDTIGQFGLGALTMFHITDCAFIFSGSKILILDPSKSHLPLEPKRASSLLDIDRVMTLYPGHFDCLRNLPCFDSNARQVNGTVFFLPLRTSSKATRGRPSLSTQAFQDASTFNEVVLAQFEVLAPEILLFPQQVQHIKAFVRQTSGQPLRSLWSTTVERSAPTNHGDFTEYSVSVNSQLRGRSSGHRTSQWLIVSRTISLADVPQSFRSNKLRKHVRLGFAAPLRGLATPSTPFEPKLYSMLPLPIQHTLPVHINASFILSSDRRNIRFDAYDDEASRFNSWIVDDAMPSLYLPLLERLAHLDGGQDNARWFPGAHPTSLFGHDARAAREGDLTSRLTKHFYATHLPSSTRRVFKSMFTNQLLTPGEAVLHPSDTTPSTIVAKTFGLLRPESLVKLDSACRRRAEKGGVTVAGPPFLKQTLGNGQSISTIQATLARGEIRELLSYLSQPNVEHLHGLPLMRLGDHSWTTFEPSNRASACYFFCEDYESKYASLFPPSRFVSPGYIDPRLLEGRNPSSSINIRPLDTAGIRQLVEEQLDALAPQRAVGEWIDRFWTSYRHLRHEGLIKAIEDLRLVPTTNPGLFKSLLEFKDGETLLIRERETALAGWFQDMGLSVVSSDALPSSLHDLLHYGEYAPKVNAFISFLRCVNPVIASAVATIQGWPFDRQREFSEHVRSLMTGSMPIPPELLATARRIPLCVAKQGNSVKHCPATEVYLLPSELDITVGRFCDRYMTDDGLVATKMGETRLNISQLHNRLQVPGLLERGEDEATYRTLLRYLLTSEHVRKGRWRIQVPSADRRMVSPQDLYERSTFFVAAFGTSSSQFLLPSFDEFTSRLPVTRDGELSMDLFARCALAFQASLEPETGDGVERAAALYGVYRERLPLLIPEGMSSQWQQAESIRFIPRELEVRAREVMGVRVDLPSALLGLPRVVAPQRIVLRTYHPIAWTQRVIMVDEPQAGSRLLLAYQGFGRPSGREVIAHLKALVTYPRGPVIQSDLKDTYRWLNGNADTLKEEIFELRDEPVFLNVDNPNYDEWNWSKASELALKAQDIPGAWQAVRRFLQPFRKLLEAAGVLEFKYPKIERQDQGAMRDREHTSFRGMRDTFNEMRLAGQLTDVRIIPQEASALTNIEALRAHRVFLAACNPWFKTMFTEGFREATEDARIDATQSSLESLIGYYYTGVPFPQADVELNDFLDTLDLAHFVEDDTFLVGAQHQIIDSDQVRELVDPRLLDYVLERAEVSNANVLMEWCQDYRDLNQALLFDMPTADSEGSLETETEIHADTGLTIEPPSSAIN